MDRVNPSRRGLPVEDRGALIRILVEAKDLLMRPENDFTYSTWEDRVEAHKEVDEFIQGIENGTFTDVDGLRGLFMVTGPLQEVSFSGWSDEFLELAERFDQETAKFH